MNGARAYDFRFAITGEELGESHKIQGLYYVADGCGNSPREFLDSLVVDVENTSGAVVASYSAKEAAASAEEALYGAAHAAGLTTQDVDNYLERYGAEDCE